MGTDVKLSSEFTIIYGGEVIAYCTDFTLEKNKEIIDITKLGDTWKNKKVDTKDFSVSFNGMVTRGDTITASLWDPTTAYSSGDYAVLAGKAWEAQGSTTGDNPTTDDGTNWIETSAWLVGTTYALGDMIYITSVAQETRIYKSLQGSNVGNDPLTETAYWERLESNYETLLKELQNNDTEVLCTIKPTATGETYYYGNGVLTSLSASITQGDKATFSGSFDGSGELTATSLGPELATGWNTAAWWDTVPSGWTFDEGVSASCDGTTGGLIEGAFWEIGKNYRVEITATRIAGSLFCPYDGAGTPAFPTITTSTTEIYDYAPDSSINMNIYSVSFEGTITALSIKEIS